MVVIHVTPMELEELFATSVLQDSFCLMSLIYANLVRHKDVRFATNLMPRYVFRVILCTI
jgi:hypothetical protein